MESKVTKRTKKRIDKTNFRDPQNIFSACSNCSCCSPEECPPTRKPKCQPSFQIPRSSSRILTCCWEKIKNKLFREVGGFFGRHMHTHMNLIVYQNDSYSKLILLKDISIHTNSDLFVRISLANWLCSSCSPEKFISSSFVLTIFVHAGNSPLSGNCKIFDAFKEVHL